MDAIADCHDLNSVSSIGHSLRIDETGSPVSHVLTSHWQIAFGQGGRVVRGERGSSQLVRPRRQLG
jgi:hypothetical protein